MTALVHLSYLAYRHLVPDLAASFSACRPLWRYQAPFPLLLSRRNNRMSSSSPSTASPSLKRKAPELPAAAAASDAKKPKANGSITSFFGQPKLTVSSTAAAATAAAAANKFDKAEWLSGLTAEQTELLRLEIDTLHDSWLPHLADEIKSKEFLAVSYTHLTLPTIYSV